MHQHCSICVSNVHHGCQAAAAAPTGSFLWHQAELKPSHTQTNTPHGTAAVLDGTDQIHPLTLDATSSDGCPTHRIAF